MAAAAEAASGFGVRVAEAAEHSFAVVAVVTAAAVVVGGGGAVVVVVVAGEAH